MTLVVIVVVGVGVVIIAYFGSAKAFLFHNRSSSIKVRIQTGDTILMSQQHIVTDFPVKC